MQVNELVGRVRDDKPWNIHDREQHQLQQERGSGRFFHIDGQFLIDWDDV